MSLHQLANHMSAQGRGPDSTLVHMSPREVSGLQSLAMAHGGTLTINPQTGLPEAGFLDSLMPTLLGGAATFFSGGAITPFMAALGVGGLTALTSKDLGKGLMAGLGAYGGAGIAGGLMNFGEAAIGAEAASGALPAGVDKFGADAIAFEPQQLAAEKAARAGATNFDRLSRGVTEGFKNPMGAFSAIGGGSKLQGAAMIGAPLLSALSSQDQTSVPTPEQIKFDPSYANINIRRDQLPYQPDTGSSAQRGYFGPTYVNRNAAEGGFVSDDGIEHFGAGGRTRRDPIENMPYIRNGQSLTPADLVNIGNRGSKRFTPVNRDKFAYPSEFGKNSLPPGMPNVNPSGYANPASSAQRSNTFVEKPVVQQPIQPAPQQPIQPITQQPMEPTRPVAQQPMEPPRPQQPMEPPRPQQPMEPTQPTQRQIDETGMVPKPVAPTPVSTQNWEDSTTGAKGGLMALAVGGGIPLDPDYDYSGYGRKKTDVVRPVTPMPDVPKPDFLAADGKTYRYDPVKKSWYVIKEAETKTNAGVETLMGGAGMGGNDGLSSNPGWDDMSDAQKAAFYGANPTFAAVTQAGQKALGFLGLTDAKQAAIARGADLDAFSGAKAISDLSKDPATGLSPGELVGGPQGGPSPTGGGGYSPGTPGSPSRDSGTAEGTSVDTGTGTGTSTGATADTGSMDSNDSNDTGLLASGGYIGRYSQGGLGSLGGYSDGGRLLRGPGDGVSDSIPATVGDRQPARLADGEFVVPARIVSELGNGSTEAGARALYKMMDRIQANRRKTTGKNSVAVNSKSHKYLPA